MNRLKVVQLFIGFILSLLDMIHPLSGAVLKAITMILGASIALIYSGTGR